MQRARAILTRIYIHLMQGQFFLSADGSHHLPCQSREILVTALSTQVSQFGMLAYTAAESFSFVLCVCACMLCMHV